MLSSRSAFSMASTCLLKAWRSLWPEAGGAMDVRSKCSSKAEE
jgi:hypothetical protein